MADLLVELFSEEIPARMQERAAGDLARLVSEGLAKAGLETGAAQGFATPRRLALVIADVPAKTPDVSSERKGPRVDAPEKAIEGFCRSAGVTLEDCEIVDDKKGSFYLARVNTPGRAASEVIGEVMADVITNFPWPKSMRWGSGSLRWVRPLHAITCVLGGKIVPFEIGGLVSGNETRGHRFMGPGAITVRDFKTYAKHLRDQFVMLDIAERRDFITNEAEKLAKAKGLTLIADPGLVHEVAGLVEWPVAFMGSFDEQFLDLPEEVIVTTIRAHQKCFCLKTADGKIANRYILVSNTIARDGGKLIVAGNDRVIAARLADAAFFWEQDAKISLEARLPKLENVTFHARLGSQRQRVERISQLAESLADKLGIDAHKARMAARLCKTDLTTDMVGELPELQGLMGGHYARREGMPDDVCDAIADHYKPQGPNDGLPRNDFGLAVAMADKLDVLTGFWAIDEKPTGSKDPYALRRAALGVIRLLLEKGKRVRLRAVIEPLFRDHLEAVQIDDEDDSNDLKARIKALADDLLAFFADRLKVFLRDKGVRHDLIDAVFALGDQDDLVMVVKRVEALNAFVDTEDGQNLLIGVRRAFGILKAEERKSGTPIDGNPLQNLLVMGEEKELNRAITTAIAQTLNALKQENFEQAMTALANLREPVDAFFAEVTVNADDPNFRENRLRLLNRIKEATTNVADFSKIEG